jgi:hypothetical protein
MNLPFSVLNTKKEKPLRIQDEESEVFQVKTISYNFETQIQDFSINFPSVDQEDINFINQNCSKFYRNNVAVLLLTLKLMKDPNFSNTGEFESYKKYIFVNRSKEKEKEGEVKKEKIDDVQKQQNFERKLGHQIKCYEQKILAVVASISRI